MYFYLERLIDNDCIAFIANLYKKGQQKEMFIDLVRSLSGDFPSFYSYQQLIQQVDGILVEPRIIIDYQGLEKQGTQTSFDNVQQTAC